MKLTEAALPEKNIFETILARRSVRAYTPQPISRSVINTLLTAAIRAPTAFHEDPWAFVIVQNKHLLQKVSEHAKPLFIEDLHQHFAHSQKQSFNHSTDPDFDIFHGAGTLIIICALASGAFTMADCWLAAENLMLVACGMGIGSCVIGSAIAALNQDAMKQELGIPSQYSAMVPIIVGIPSGDTPATPRQAARILCWND